MSRFGDEDGGDLPEIFWAIDLRRALTSGRGQRILRELEAALLALPERALIKGEIVRFDQECQQGAVCAVGAYAAYRSTLSGIGWQQAMSILAETWSGEQGDNWATRCLGKRIGLARTVATELAYQNDEQYGHLSPEDRWGAILGWIREQIHGEVLMLSLQEGQA